MTRRKGASMIVDETDGSDLPVLSRDDAGLVRPQATTPTEGLSRLSLEQAVSLLIAEREAYIDLQNQAFTDAVLEHTSKQKD